MGYSRQWNSGATANGRKAARPRRSRPWLFALLAGVVAALLAALVFIRDDGERPVKTPAREPRAKPSKPKTVPAPKREVPQTVQAEPTNQLSEAWQKYYDGRDTNQWIVVKDPKTGKEYLSRLLKPGPKNRKPPLYKAHALNALHAILFKDPGTPLPGIRIDDRFVQSFQEALLEKIEISDEDSEEDRLNKNSMIETMAFLKQEIKNGGDIKAIVGEALLERQRVATLKGLMIQERVKMRNEGASEEEIAEFEEACNKKLAERGASPMLNRKTILERLERKLNAKEVSP